MSNELELTDGSASGTWILRNLRGGLGHVGSHVPDCFDSYVRILHPAMRSDGREVTWREVAQEKDRHIHPLVQWHALIGVSDPEKMTSKHWQGSSPLMGTLPPALLRSLLLFLQDWTKDGSTCFFAIWDGWSANSSVAMPKESPLQWLVDRNEGFEEARALNEPDAARLELSQRSYVVLKGKLQSLVERPKIAGGISPNIIWPADRTWLMATEIDFDSTLVGGSRRMARALLDSKVFEAWEVSPEDSLAFRSDRINM